LAKIIAVAAAVLFISSNVQAQNLLKDTAVYAGTQIGTSAGNAVYGTVNAIKDGAQNAVATAYATTMSNISLGPDATGHRYMTRDEMEAAGLPEDQIDTARYEAGDWAIIPKDQIKNAEELRLACRYVGQSGRSHQCAEGREDDCHAYGQGTFLQWDRTFYRPARNGCRRTGCGSRSGVSK